VKSPKRIVVVVGDLDLGGTQIHLSQVLPRLDRSRFAVEICTLTHKGQLAAALESQGVPVHAMVGKGRWKRASRMSRLYLLVMAAGRLYRKLRREKTEIVHLFLPEAYLIGGVCAWLAGIPRRVMSRRSLNAYQMKYPMISRFEKSLHSTMHLITGNSAAVIKNLQQEGVPEDRLRLIYNGIDLMRFEPRVDRLKICGQLGVRPDALVFILVANLIAYKGHAELLRAFGSIKERLSIPWVLLCVGRDSGIQAELELICEQEGIVANVYFLGPRLDVSQLMSAADIGLLCSHQEGFSNSILEGMAAGLPMIVTKVGGNPEAVLDKVTGLVVPVGDGFALGESLVQLARDSGLRDRYGQAGRQRVQERFSLGSCVAAYHHLYDDLYK
jgi:glycosyltransferase involved in cell wall biosynthesis